MAPKANAAGLQKAFRELGEQLTALQPKGGAGLRRGDSGPKWDCKHCDRGLDNYPDRTTCYRCKRDRNAPAIPKGASGPSGERAERAASVRTRKVAGEPAPMLGVGDGEVGEEEDPIAVELAAAKSYTEWVRRQKAGPAREKELAAAHKRLAEAELADKRRRRRRAILKGRLVSSGCEILSPCRWYQRAAAAVRGIVGCRVTGETWHRPHHLN